MILIGGNMDKWNVYKKCDDFRVETPESVFDLIEIKSIAENGIFEIGKGGVFTKTYRISDINYADTSVDEQIIILEKWCHFLNAQSVPFKITFNNKNKNMATLREEVLLRKKLNEFDVYRDMFNSEIEDRIVNGRTGIQQELYITIRYEASAVYEDAKIYFATLENSMVQSFRELGSELVPLDASERLRILHDFYQFGLEENFGFDFKKAVESALDFKEFVVPSKMDFTKEDMISTLSCGKRMYATCLYIKQYPGSLSDRFITNLTKLNIKMMGSIDIVPISDSDTDALLYDVYNGIENRIRKQNKNRVKDMDFNSDISLSVKMEKDDIEKLIREKREEDQHFFYVLFNLMVIADSEEQLKKDVELVKITANKNSVTFDVSWSMQLEAMNTILPIGVRQVKNGRNLQTKSLTALFPFNVQELMIPGGNWYGVNQVSKNILMGNRKKLLNPHGFIFGVTGSGKTSMGTMEIMQTFLNTDDDIIVLDPKNDYQTLSRDLKGTYVDVGPDKGITFNPLETVGGQSTGVSYIADSKAELVLAICEECKKGPLTAKESSLVNRSLKYAYNEEILLNGESAIATDVTLTSLYNAFDKMEEPEAKDLMLYMELFVKGSLNIFAGKSNVAVTDNRLLMFGLKNMGKGMKNLAMLVILEHIKERIIANAAMGRVTWLYIDELESVLDTEYTQSYVKSLWMLVRSLGGIMTGLTQNVSSVMKSSTTRSLVENSEFLLIFKQRDSAYEDLTDGLGLPGEMVNKYVIRETLPGKGLIRHGSVTVPLDMSVNKESELYNIIKDTNFYEKHELHQV